MTFTVWNQFDDTVNMNTAAVGDDDVQIVKVTPSKVSALPLNGIFYKWILV